MAFKSTDQPTARYFFPNTTFRDIRVSSLASDGHVFMSYDHLHGIALYRIRISDCELEAFLVGKDSLASEPSLPQRYKQAFVSGICLGARGLRGIWIERERGVVKRKVVVLDVPTEGSEVLCVKPVYHMGSYDLRGMLMMTGCHSMD